MKRCFKCHKTQPLGQFYAHPEMADGHLNKCKACTLADVAQRYANKREEIAAYERRRSQTLERKQKVLGYQRTRRERYPEKNRARQAVSNAIRDGRLTREPCMICGATAQAHHEDYSKPLEVQWLCFQHHREYGHGQQTNQRIRPC